MLIRRLLWPAVLLPLAAAARAVEWEPVLNGTLSGGQYFFQRQKGNFTGNASLTAAAAAKLSEKWTVLPLYSGQYRGTKGVDDGVGSGTLFQQSMDHAASVTGIRSLEGGVWRLKPSAGYKRQFLKETRDERWGKGLFDYDKMSVGFEAENLYKDPFSWRVGVDAFRIRFPNYISLESQSGADPFGNPLGRELAPRRVLDSMNYQLSASGSRPFPFHDPVVVLTGAYGLLFKDFEEQRVVNAGGQYDRSRRRDWLQSLTGSVGRPIPVRPFDKEGRLDLSAGLQFAYNKSNQNTYDAAFAQFVRDAYSYWSLEFAPSATLSWGDKNTPDWLSASVRASRMQYLGRLTQNGSGLYGGSKQTHDRLVLGLGVGRALSPGLTLIWRVNGLWARSNHKYNENYAYDYRALNYTLGISWEY